MLGRFSAFGQLPRVDRQGASIRSMREWMMNEDGDEITLFSLGRASHADSGHEHGYGYGEDNAALT